jgi:hypothetical protein
LDTKKTLVLNYYIVDGQRCHDVSLLRSKAWRGSGTIRYVAQVQIATSAMVNLNASSAEKKVCVFAVDSASSISEIFENTEDDQFLDESNFHTSGIIGGIGSD